jgi:hypothetical protein
LGDLGIDGRIRLKFILNKLGKRTLTGFIWLRIVAGSCEHGNEPSGSIKGKEFLDQLSDY